MQTRVGTHRKTYADTCILGPWCVSLVDGDVECDPDPDDQSFRDPTDDPVDGEPTPVPIAATVPVPDSVGVEVPGWRRREEWPVSLCANASPNLARTECVWLAADACIAARACPL